MCPYATAASRIDWNLFVTLTYACSGLRQNATTSARNSRRRMLFAFVRKIEKAFGVPKGNLIWLAREELGEKGQMFHYHILIGGLHYVAGRGVVPSPNPISDRYRVAALWEQCGTGAGRNDVREYNPDLSGVLYVMKGLDSRSWSYGGANHYELGKFDESEEGRELIPAPAFHRAVDRWQSRNRRHRKARDLKIGTRDRSTRGVSKTGFKPARFVHPHDPTKR